MSEEIKNTQAVKGQKKKNPWVLPIILIVLLVPIIAAAVILYGHVATVASVHLVDQDLYQMTVKQDYFLDEVLEANLSSEETLAKYLTHKMYFGLADGFVQNLEFGCSSFLARTPDGEYIAGRNYDYDEAGELVFYTHPSDGFAAVCMTEFGALGLNETTGILPDSFLGKTAMMLAPYYTMDGVNKKGVMVSLLQLTPGAPHPRTEKPDIMLTVAIRLILDRAESVDHAIALLEQYDVHDDGKYSHHLFISDSNGNAVVVEWPGAQMKVVKDQPAVTNFVLSRGNKSTFIGNCDRFDKIMDWLDNHSTTTSEQAMELLEAISQTDTGYPTQWSSVYHLSDCSMDITIDRHYDKVYHFSPKDSK